VTDEVHEAPMARSLSRRRFLAGLVVAPSAGALLAACSSSSSPSTATSPSSSSFPIGAASRATSKPVSITVWHSMTSNNLTTLQSLTESFQRSQSDVVVNLVNQDDYTDTMTLYTESLSGGPFPDVVQIESSDLQLMVDSQSVVPASAAVMADGYSLSDFVPSTVAYFRTGTTLWAMPFNISSQILFYDQNAFQKAGLDPSVPPATLDDVRSAAQKIVSSGTEKFGLSFKTTPSNFEQWMALGDQLLVNNDNGRSARATAVAFDNSFGESLFSWISELFTDKLAQPTSPTTYDNLIGIANRIAPMTLETSGALGTVVSLLDSGQYSDVKLGVGPLPRPTGGTGGVFVGGAGLYMSKRSPPERKDAAWQYIKYLVGSAQQAQWAVGTGFIPIRKSAVTQPVLVDAWQKMPAFRIAYQQVLGSPANPASAGAVCGAQAQVDNAIQSAMSQLAEGVAPATALRGAGATANQAIASYNSRV
jgi:sn-glycerol 3-phosphate transport system substrate-binding protein